MLSSRLSYIVHISSIQTFQTTKKNDISMCHSHPPHTPLSYRLSRVHRNLSENSPGKSSSCWHGRFATHPPPGKKATLPERKLTNRFGGAKRSLPAWETSMRMSFSRSRNRAGNAATASTSTSTPCQIWSRTAERWRRYSRSPSDTGRSPLRACSTRPR